MAKQPAATELTPGNIKNAVKAAGGSSGDLWKIPPAQLRVIPGFNIRDSNTEKYKARVRWIADSIKANGYMIEHPLEGYAGSDGGEDVVFITGGHRRHEAVLLAISENYPVEFVPVVVPKGRNMVDLTVALVVGNDSDPVTTYEAATACKRLIGLGLESAQIATRLGYASAQYVDGLLALVAAPLPVRKMVMEGVISATTAIDALKKHGDKAQEVLLGAVVKAGTTGRKRVTAKHMPDAVFKKSVRKQAQPMYDALITVTTDPGFAKLTKEVQILIGEALGGVKKK